MKDSFKNKHELIELLDSLRAAFLFDWSETPDNIETSKFLNIGQIQDLETGNYIQGLILKSENELISNTLWTAFGESEVPEEVLQNYPNLKKNEWNQIIRIAQIVISSFEYNEKSNK